MPIDELLEEFNRYLTEQRKYHNEAITKNETLKSNYLKMLDAVNKWMPPTREHRELKDFMQEQIQKSIDWDCDGDYHRTSLLALPNNAEVWRTNKLLSLERDIKYHAEEYQKETVRVNERNAWVVIPFALMGGEQSI